MLLISGEKSRAYSRKAAIPRSVLWMVFVFSALVSDRMSLIRRHFNLRHMARSPTTMAKYH